MANSGPGWEGIDVAWDWLQYDLEYERQARKRVAPSSPAGAETPPSSSRADRAPSNDAV